MMTTKNYIISDELQERLRRTSRRYPCPDCGSSDGLAKYETNTYCFACETWHRKDSEGNEDGEQQESHKFSKDLTIGQFYRIKERGLTEDTCKKYGTTVLVKDRKIIAYVHPYYQGSDMHIANKIRYLPKNYTIEGYIQRAGLFGQQVFAPGCAKAITLCEGEEDAMAAYQMQGSKYPVVSLKNGASNAAKDVKASLEYLESFDKVYVCFDPDDPGIKATNRIASLLSPGKVHIVQLDKDLKDPCGYLAAGKSSEFITAWWGARMYTPAGILRSSELKERIRNRKDVPSLPYPLDGLNDMTYGIRKGEAVIITAQTGIGKTHFLREVCHHLLRTDPSLRIGTMYLEETPEDSGLGLMSIEANVPFHLPDAKYTEADYDRAEKILDEDRVYFYDSFGCNDIDDLINRIRYYCKGLDCTHIFLDHLSIIVSDQTQGDERKLLDSIMTRLKTLTIELDMALIAVVHQNREGQIRGTAGIEQLANIVIRMERDKMNADPSIRNTTKFFIEKNRFCGRTGPAAACKYDAPSGRLREVDADFEELTDESISVTTS